MNLQKLADEIPEVLATQLAPSLLDKYTLFQERPPWTSGAEVGAWVEERDNWPDPLSSLALTCRSLHAVAVHDIIWRGCFGQQHFVFGKGVSGAELSRRWLQAAPPWFASPTLSIFAPSSGIPSLQTTVCHWLAKNLHEIEALDIDSLPSHLADLVRTAALDDLLKGRPMDGAGWWRRLFRATKILEQRHLEHVVSTEKTGTVWLGVERLVTHPDACELKLAMPSCVLTCRSEHAGVLWTADLKTGYGAGPPELGHVVDLPHSCRPANQSLGFGRRAFCLSLGDGDDDDKVLVAESEEEAAAWVKKINFVNERFGPWHGDSGALHPALASLLGEMPEDLSGVAQRLQITVESD